MALVVKNPVAAAVIRAQTARRIVRRIEVPFPRVMVGFCTTRDGPEPLRRPADATRTDAPGGACGGRGASGAAARNTAISVDLVLDAAIAAAVGRFRRRLWVDR
jgi:hypothetical protein